MGFTSRCIKLIHKYLHLRHQQILINGVRIRLFYEVSFYRHISSKRKNCFLKKIKKKLAELNAHLLIHMSHTELMTYGFLKKYE